MHSGKIGAAQGMSSPVVLCGGYRWIKRETAKVAQPSIADARADRDRHVCIADVVIGQYFVRQLLHDETDISAVSYNVCDVLDA